MSARSDALAFRIWQIAEPLGWDCTVREIADDLGESWHRVHHICFHRRWTELLRKSSAYDTKYNSSVYDPMHGLTDLAGMGMSRREALLHEAGIPE